MGFKASIITIKNPRAEVSDDILLKTLGFDNLSFSDNTTLEECMYPNDKSINFGHYNDCLIISDDYQLTTSLELSTNPQKLVDYEKILTNLFPGTEILTIACHSAVNYHMYSLIKDGEKLRFKKVVHGEPLIEYGERMEEEKRIYDHSKIIDGIRMFKSSYEEKDVYEYTEDQMMEAFAFGVVKRHLGVMISHNEADELTFEINFEKYIATKVLEKKKEVQKNSENTLPTKGS